MRRRTTLVAFTILVCVYLASPNVLPRGDAALSVPTAASLVHERNVDLGEFLDVEWVAENDALTHYRGRDVDFFPWLNAAAAIPVVVVVDLFSIAGTPSTTELIEQDRSWIVHYVAAGLWSAAAATMLALLSLAVLEHLRLTGTATTLPPWMPGWLTRWPIVTVSLLVGLTTPLWSVTSRTLIAHGPALLCVTAALLIALRGTSARSAALAGGLCALAFWIRPATLPAAIAVAAVVLIVRRRHLAALAGGAVAVHGLVAVANVVLYGTWRPPYFHGGRVSVHDAYAEALGANLVSPARGLLVACPQMLLLVALALPSVRRRLTRRDGWLIAAFVATAAMVLLLVSGYGLQWWAGHTYGPRFMTDALPYLVPLAVAASVVLCGRAAGSSRWVPVLVVVAWSVAGLVHWQGGWFHSTQCWNGAPRTDIDIDPSRVWSLRDPQLTSGWRTLAADGPAAALWRSCPDAADAATTAVRG